MLVRPSMPETTALGAAVAAGLADGIAVWNLDSTMNNADTSADVFTASIPESSKDGYVVCFLFVRNELLNLCKSNVYVCLLEVLMTCVIS